MRPLLLTFPSTHQAILAEETLREVHILLEVVPAPPGADKGCGLAIRFGAGDLDRVMRTLANHGVRWSAVMDDTDHDPGSGARD